MSRVSDFRSYLTGGGARPTQFLVGLNFPKWLDVPTPGAATQFLVKAASLPASVIQPIDVPFRGRVAKIAGERQFANWNVTVINDNDFLIRNALESWSNAILKHTSTGGRIAPNEYAVDLTVTQLDRNDLPIKEYTFRDCFPQQIADIQLDFGAVAAIEEFQVEFSVDYWEVTKFMNTRSNITT